MKELNTNVWFYLLLTVMSFAGVCITVWLGGAFLVATFLFGAGTVFSVVSVFNSNFAHRFCLCTLKIQYLAGIRLSKFHFLPYAA